MPLLALLHRHQQQPSYSEAPDGQQGGMHPEYAQGYAESAQGYPESAQGYPESAYEPSPHSSSLPSAHGPGSGRMTSPYSSGQAAPSPYGVGPSSYGGSPQGPGGPGYGGGSYGGSPPSQGGGAAGYEQGYEQDPRGGSQQRGVTFDQQSVGEQYEDDIPPGSDGRPQSQGSGQLYHSAEFPLGANPNRECLWKQALLPGD